MQAKNQVWSGKNKKRQGMAVDNMPHVHELPEQPACKRRLDSGSGIKGLGRGQVMGGGTDPADAGSYLRQSACFHADQDALESSQLIDTEKSLVYLAGIIALKKDSGMSLYPGDRIDCDGL
jgi:hypothetical protein